MALASDYVKEKRKETVLEKYGVDNVGKCEVIKEKRKETCLKNMVLNILHNYNQQ